MRKLILLLIILFPVIAKCQIVESFDDNDFINNPVWYGETTKFEVVNPPISGDGSLNASAGNDGKVLRSLPSQGDAVLTLPSTTAYGEWRFSIADGANWAISGTNDFFVILMSDDSTVTKLKDGALNFNGYFLRFDGDVSDTYVLYKQSGTTSTPVISTGYPASVDGTTAIGRTIKITRSNLGEWSIFIDEGFNIDPSTQRGTTYTENSIATSSWFGIVTNIANPGTTRVVYFDYLYIGEIVGDTVKPQIDSVEVLSSRSLKVSFTEALDQATAETVSNYFVNNGISNPDSAILNSTDQKSVILYFSTDFSDGVTNSLSVQNVADISLNIISPISIDFTYYLIKALSVSVVSSTQLSVKFSQQTDLVSAQTLLNYSVNNSIGNPIAAVVNFSDPTLVDLTFSSSFTSGSSYILTVQNVTDVNGTAVSSTDLPFSYFVVSKYDVVINEILADPTPIVLLPDAEFVELYNTTPFDIQMNGWTITTGTTVKSIPNTTLNAFNYLIICTSGTQDQFSIYGDAFGVLSSSALTNTGQTIKIKNENAVVIDSVTYSDSWYQDAGKKNGGWTLEKIDPVNNCGGASNWIASIDYRGGTPSEINSVFAHNVDTVAPVVNSVLVLDSNHVSITFSEVVENISASGASNYFINNNIGNPDSIYVNQDVVTLYFSQTFAEGQQNTLSIYSIKDYCNNLLDSSVHSIAFYRVHPYDVVINELMPDPSPVVSLPEWEYVELYNRTNHLADLINWTITIGTTTKTIPNVQMEANGYLLICSSYAYDELLQYGNTVGIYNLGALVNTGQTVTVKDNTGAVMSSVTYSDDWYGDPAKIDGGWSLEAIDPNNFCGGINNWKASVDERGGTPGEINSVHGTNIDTIAPVLNYILVYDNQTLILNFSEQVDASLAENINNYSYGNNVLDSVLVDPASPSNVYMYFSSEFEVGVEQYITIASVQDLCGNQNNSLTGPYTYNHVYPYDVVINEIMADPDPVVGLPAAEYIEIYNAADYDIDLIQWTLKSGSTTKTIPNSKIYSKGYLILCHENNASLFSSYGTVVGVPSFPSLANTGQSLTIKDYYGNVIHSVTYSDSWYGDKYKAEGGWSLELIDPENPCGEKSNWIASTDIKGGTPGSINSVDGTNPDIINPELTRAFITNLVSKDSVKVIFNEYLTYNSLLDTANYLVDNSVGYPESVIPVEPQYNSVILVFADSFKRGMIYTLTIIDTITDCSGNRVTTENTCRFAVPDTATPGEVVINEVLFNPYTDGVDFVELYNNSDKTFDLRDLKLANRTDGEVDNIKAINSEGFLFFPDDYLVITTDPDIVKSQYSTTNPKGFVEAASLPSYNDDDGDVVLIDTWENIIDEVVYNSDMQYALLQDLNGVSLERIDFNRASDDNTNWHSASETVGFATPAYRNSQYFETLSDGADLSVSPEIFSPDNDAYNDVLNINYTVKEPGYTGSIIIYDAKGRVIRKLVENVLLADQGVFTWDGLTDGRTKANIGIYIVYFEAFNLDGKVIKIKKPCVLATRLN